MIRLRPIKNDDGPAVFTAVDHSRPQLARWMDWYHHGYSLADAYAWVERSVSQHTAATAFHFAICDAHGQLIGVVSLEDVAGPRAMLGYWVTTPATGQGVATAAVQDVLAWATTHTRLRLVRARVAPENLASRRVVEANGFHVATGDPYSPSEGQMIYERPILRESAA